MLRLLKGRSFPGKVLITRRSDPLNQSVFHSPRSGTSYPDGDYDHDESMDRSNEVFY